MSWEGPRFPADEPPIDPKTGTFGWRYLRWFNGLRTSIDAASTLVPQGVVQRSGLTAAIGTTAIPTAALGAGLYEVNWYAQVITPAGVTSSFQVTISWTRNGVGQSFTGTLQNGNTTLTQEGDRSVLIHIDGASPVSYAVAYASNPANAMVYEINVTLRVVSLDD